MSAEVQFTQLFDLLDANIHQVKQIQHQYMALLSELTTVNALTTNVFLRCIERINEMGTIIVGVIKEENIPFRIVATGTLIVEPKLIHGGRCVGHIEDVVVASDMRRQGVGQKLLNILKCIARENGCYKVILDCDDHLCPVYEKNGLQRRGIQMAEYFCEEEV
ncbi:MAG: GNAT family N-acetyltransferase [Flavobacterium sp.]